MKKVLKNFALFSLVLLNGFYLSSCGDKEDDLITDPQTQAKITATASTSTATLPNSRMAVGAFTVTQFTVGTQNVEMKYFAKADLTAGISLGNLQSKTILNANLQKTASSKKSNVLITGGKSQFSLIGEGTTPEGNYTEATFKLYKNAGANANDPMFQKSVLITGTINGKITQFWTESEKMLRASTKTSTGVELNQNTEVVLVFEMDKLFAGVDFTKAMDANGDGRIEISPSSPDGNAAIFSKIEANMESAVSLRKR
ncbi:hypothetical protein [Algoriphagus sp.]|uniref:hypothetical protein n=1 Tax=Algoriphagus sp. TaxID=1872435 RepID=UPI0039196E4F